MLTEADIIKGCQQNTASAQKMLYMRYAPVLKSVCLRYIKNREEAKDVLHDGFLKIFKHIGKYNGTGSFEGWLKRIVIHVALDYIKKSQKISFGSQSNLENVPEEEESTYLHSEQLLNTGFSAQELLVLLHRIPEQYAAVFNLYYIDNLSHKEIAQAIEIDENTSRTRLHRAKIVLRKELEHELEKRQRAQIL